MITKIAILAGETSGDNYGALLAAGIRKLAPGVSIFGTGGPKMKESLDHVIEGMPYGQMGFSGVIKNFHMFYAAYRKVCRETENRRPDLIIFIDNPGFNLKTAQALGKTFPCFYYIPPKIWAHNYGRIKVLKKYIKSVVPVFPFEQEIYRREGIDCKWLGHPASDLVEGFRPACRDDKNNSSRPLVGLLPGSRKEEIEHLLPVFIRIVRRLGKDIPLRVLLSASDTSMRAKEEAILARHRTVFNISEGSPYDIIRESSLLLAASGTVNIEAALLEKPLIVFYKTSAFNYLLARIMVKLSFISPVNLLLGEKAVPEYIQRFPYDRITEDCADILGKGTLFSRQVESFRRIKKLAGTGRTSDRAAEYILERYNLLKKC